MKECSNEKVIIGKKFQNDPPYQSSQSNPGGQQDEGHGVVLHDQGEGDQPPITSMVVNGWE